LKELVTQFEGATLFDPTTAEEKYQNLPYMLEFGERSDQRGIDIEKARELEAKREELKQKLEKLIDEFLQK
jgi:hypothetical protein